MFGNCPSQLSTAFCCIPIFLPSFVGNVIIILLLLLSRISHPPFYIFKLKFDKTLPQIKRYSLIYCYNINQRYSRLYHYQYQYHYQYHYHYHYHYRYKLYTSVTNVYKCISFLPLPIALGASVSILLQNVFCISFRTFPRPCPT